MDNYGSILLIDDNEMDNIIKIRTDVARKLEKMRAAKHIGNSLEAAVDL